jgi:hypothetical protein
MRAVVTGRKQLMPKDRDIHKILTLGSASVTLRQGFNLIIPAQRPTKGSRARGTE